MSPKAKTRSTRYTTIIYSILRSLVAEYTRAQAHTRFMPPESHLNVYRIYEPNSHTKYRTGLEVTPGL